MENSSVDAVKVLQRARVCPPEGSVHNTSIPLTFFDVLWFFPMSVERVFFYTKPCSFKDFVHEIIPGLKSSLSVALQHYFPLAGRVRQVNSATADDDRYEIYYAECDSVELIVAECQGDFEELKGHHARDIRKLRALVPTLPMFNETSSPPLVALQATVFPNRGISIGVAMQHVVCDGSSSMHFMKFWATLHKSGACGGSSSLPSLPLHDRSKLIPDPKNLFSLFLNEMRNIAKSMANLNKNRKNNSSSSEVTSVEQVVHSTFTLTRDQIDKLKQQVSAMASETSKVPFHCSTFVVVCAYVWVCLDRARGAQSIFGCVVDCRSRLKPPVAHNYFGNCLRFILADADCTGSTDEEDHKTSLLIRSEAIGRTIAQLSEGVLNDAEEWIPTIRSQMVKGKRFLSVAGSPKLRVYEIDFGWGKPDKVDVLSIENNGSMSIAESRDGEGGLEIGLALPLVEMDKFSSRFSHGLQKLS